MLAAQHRELVAQDQDLDLLSGKYQGAEGEVRVQPVSGTTGILTFHLTD